MGKYKQISFYLKDKIKDYPSIPIPYSQFLAECSYDLGYKQKDFEEYIKTMEQLGYVEISNGNIISIPASSKLEVEKESQNKLEEEFKNATSGTISE